MTGPFFLLRCLGAVYRVLPAVVIAASLAVTAGTASAQTRDSESVRDGSLAGAYLAARSAVMAGNHREAAQYFARALDQDPDNMVLIGNAIFANAALGNWDAAAEVAARMPRLPGQRADLADLVLLVDLMRRGDLAAAEAMIDESRGAGPFIDALAQGWLALGAGDMNAAEAAFMALTLDRGLSELAWMHMAYAWAAVGDFERADAILGDGSVGALVNSERVVRARAEILVQLDRRADALDVLDQFTSAVPNPALLALQARIGAGAEGPYAFISTAQQGLAEVFFTVADALGADSDSSLPLIYARAAHAISPDLSQALLLAGDILVEDDQPDLAVEAYGAVASDDDYHVEAQMRRADALEVLGRTEEAISALRAVLAEDPGLALVHASLGDILRRDEQHEAAIDAYTDMLALVDTDEPRYWFIYFARAISYHQSDNWPPAEADFRRALELNPEQPQVLNYLGYSLVEQRRNFDEALDMIERAVAARPDSGYIVDSLGWVYYRLGRFEEAVAPMERAVELLPTDPIINDHLGDVYWMVGREREARFQWERALSFDPEEEDAERIRLKLEIGLDRVLEEEGGVGAAP